MQFWLIIVAVMLSASAFAASVGRNDLAVIDGETIRAHGKTYRLVGIDVPETTNAKCPTERDLGERAAKRLKEIIDLGGLDLKEVPCACVPGTQGTQLCNHGRLCGVLTAGGSNVGFTLIREGLARPYYCGKYRCPKQRSWC